jgi:hypothetical protein
VALCPSVGRGSYPLAPSFPPSSSQGGQVPEPGFPSLNKKMDVWQTQCVRPAANPCGQVAAVVWACGQVFDLSICPYGGASCPSSRVLWAFALVSFGVGGYGGESSASMCINGISAALAVACGKGPACGKVAASEGEAVAGLVPYKTSLKTKHKKLTILDYGSKSHRKQYQNAPKRGAPRW